ncbi:MAG: fluoride efflux transporter CrcB [Vulcanimicrobiaceae bacterium]
MYDARAMLVVGVGAALGGIARFVLGSIVVTRAGAGAAPLATLFINVSGSFLIGLALGGLGSRPDVSPLWRLFIATGILGGYTTFSTFSFEVLSLASGGAPLAAAAYALASVGCGIAAAFAGLALARTFA